MNQETWNEINSYDRASIEALMDLCLTKMSEKDLEDTRQMCARRLQTVESEIARRKEQRNEQEGGFAA